MTEVYKDKIGYLSYEGTLQFSGGRISSLLSFDNAYEYVNKRANKDGFFYPPIVETYLQNHEVIDGILETHEELIPNTKRPAQMFKLPASHEIQLFNPVYTNEPRSGDGLFITYLIAFIFGVRLQFFDWFFDGKVPINPNQDFLFSPSATENFLDSAYRIWRNNSDDQKKLITNLLYMQTKIRSYEWDWERFLISYMIIDGCYRYLNETQGVISGQHRNRIKAVLEYFNMKLNLDWIDQIVNLRNELFHETLWVGGQPGNSGTTYSYSAAFHLSKLNNRVIFAILGYQGEYIRSSWWSRGTYMF